MKPTPKDTLRGRVTGNLHLAESDKVLWRFTAQAAHTGPLMDIPATGKRVIVTGMALFRVANGTIAEVWVNFDTLGMLQAIGVIPALA